MRCEANTADVWLVDLQGESVDSLADQSILSANEQARIGRLRSIEQQRQSLVARVALRRVLARYLDCPPAEVAFSTNQWGKPAIANPNPANLQFNQTHTAGLQLIACSLQPIGIDAEAIKPFADVQGLIEQICTVNEQAMLRQYDQPALFTALYRCWTSKEAVMKATGHGLQIEPRAFEVEVRLDYPPALQASTTPVINPNAWRLHSIAVPPNYSATLATAPSIEQVRVLGYRL